MRKLISILLFFKNSLSPPPDLFPLSCLFLTDHLFFLHFFCLFPYLCLLYLLLLSLVFVFFHPFYPHFFPFSFSTTFRPPPPDPIILFSNISLPPSFFFQLPDRSAQASWGGSLRRRKEIKGALFKEITAKNFQNLMEDMNINNHSK